MKSLFVKIRQGSCKDSVANQQGLAMSKLRITNKSALKMGVVTGALLALISICFNAHAEIYYYHNDHLGAPQVITNQNQQVVWRGVKKPFGETEEVVNTIENNIGLPGQYLDRESGNYYNYFRDYDSTVGRYVQSDPIGLEGGMNTYGYAYQNPTMYIDAFGLNAACAEAGAAGGSFVCGPVCAVIGAIGGGLIGGWATVEIWDSYNNESSDTSDEKEKDPPKSEGNKPPHRDQDRPRRGEPNSWVEGNKGGRQYGEDGKPNLDIDAPHQGHPDWHVHEWPGGVREHPGRPVSPIY